MKKENFFFGLILFTLATTPDADEAVQRSCALAAIFSPSSPFATLQDFEITVDPEDPNSNLLFTANVERGTLDGTVIYIMQLDGRTGMVSGAPRIIANNYAGKQKVNGPEFAYHPDHGLGVLLAGPRGVHAAWRTVGSAWHEFKADLAGLPFPKNSPPPLPATSPGRHPKDSQSFGFETYAEIDFRTHTCTEVCYGTLSGDSTTDLKIALEKTLGFFMYRSTIHPVADKYSIFTGCRFPPEVAADCGLFEVKIDGHGGIEPDTFRQLAALSAFPIQTYPQIAENNHQIAARMHPVTGHLIVGLLHNLSLMIWESESPHTPLNLIGQLTDLPTGSTETPEHLRFVFDSSRMYANFFVRDGDQIGSYVSVLDGMLYPPIRIDDSDPSGSELVYLPVANRLAIYLPEVTRLPNGVDAQAVKRCWIDL